MRVDLFFFQNRNRPKSGVKLRKYPCVENHELCFLLFLFLLCLLMNGLSMKKHESRPIFLPKEKSGKKWCKITKIPLRRKSRTFFFIIFISFSFTYEWIKLEKA